MRYAFDLDDTISDTAKVINMYAKEFDINFLKGDGIFKKEVGNSKDYYYFADALDWDRNDIGKFFETYYLDILKNVTIKPGISNIFKLIKNRGDEVFIISSRRERENAEIEKLTIDWLNKNNVIYDKLFINIKNKYELVNKYNIDVFIDDSYNNCKDVARLTTAKVYMVQNIYNEKIVDDSITKIKELKDIL